MKIPAFIKRAGVAVLVLGVAAGCAATQEEEMVECEGISPEVQTAIDDANAAIQTARDIGAEWRGARKLVNQAEAAGAECNDEEALRLAAEAQMMAEEMIAFERSQQEEEKEMVEEEEEEMDRTYTVVRGDNLWDISASTFAYNDPYQWPLIYRANQDKIDDADLIYPGQRLTIQVNPSSSAVDAAIQHARTRGAWELGPIEESDKRYLANNP